MYCFYVCSKLQIKLYSCWNSNIVNGFGRKEWRTIRYYAVIYSLTLLFMRLLSYFVTVHGISVYCTSNDSVVMLFIMLLRRYRIWC